MKPLVALPAIALALSSSSPARAAPREPVDAAAPKSTDASPDRDAGSLWTTRALGRGRGAMSMGGGVAVLLPYYGLEAGFGLNDWLDLVGRFETVLGILHYPHVGLRAMVLRLGSWRVGTRLLTHYSFFGIQSDKLNVTSTLYSSLELAVSGPVSSQSHILFGASGEFDWFEYDVIEDEAGVRATTRYDATNFRAVLLTPLTGDLDGYLQFRLRVPTETFTYEATELYVLPFIEVGGTWGW